MIKMVILGKQPINMCSCVHSLWRWSYLITTICLVCSCFVRRDGEEDSVGQKTFHSAKKSTSCCLESCFHLCSSLRSTSLAQNLGMTQRKWAGDLIHSLCATYICMCVCACAYAYIYLLSVQHTLILFTRAGVIPTNLKTPRY